MRLARLATDQSLVEAKFSSHYEVIDADLYHYILTMDAEAWRRYLHGVVVCPFCGTEVTPSGSCCQRFLEFRQATTAAANEKLLRGQADVKSKSDKSKGKKFSIMKEAERKKKDYLATRFV